MNEKYWAQFAFRLGLTLMLMAIWEPSKQDQVPSERFWFDRVCIYGGMLLIIGGSV